MKSQKRSFILCVMVCCCAIFIYNSAYAADCTEVENLVDQNNLKNSIENGNIDSWFPLPSGNMNLESCWTSGCDVQNNASKKVIIGDCVATKLGTLFARIAITEEYKNDKEKCRKLISFIQKLLEVFQSKGFITIGRSIYNSFAKSINSSGAFNNNLAEADNIKQAITNMENTVLVVKKSAGVDGVKELRDKLARAEEQLEALIKDMGELKNKPIPEEENKTNKPDGKSEDDSSLRIGFISLFIVVLLIIAAIALLYKETGGIKMTTKATSIINSKAQKDISERLTIVEHNFDVIESTNRSLQKLIEGIENRMSGLGVETKTINPDIEKRLARIERTLTELREAITQLSESKPPEQETAVPDIPSAITEMEQKMFSDRWRSFKITNSDLVTLAINFKPSGDKDVYELLLGKDLSILLSSHDLKLFQRYVPLILPLKDNNHILQSLEQMNNYKEGDQKNVSVFRYWTQILVSLQINRDMSQKLIGFELRDWIRDHFIQIAEGVVSTYQNLMPDKREESLLKLHDLVIRILEIGDLKPVDIILGKTIFEGKEHIGRSTTTENSLPDRVITGVVRSGFMRIGDGKVVLKPEVTVNKV